MEILITNSSNELRQAIQWWVGLEIQWKMAFNEACFGKGPSVEAPTDDELMLLLVRADALRFAGPTAHAPNLSHIPTNLSGLSELKHLTYLCFSDSKITSLREISGLTKLRSLFVINNEVTSLEGVEAMTDLEMLYVQGNNIKSLTPIQHLTNLHTLYVNHNQLTSLEGITLEHEEKLRDFYVLPNQQLRHREIIRIQNEYGILCKNV